MPSIDKGDECFDGAVNAARGAKTLSDQRDWYILGEDQEIDGAPYIEVAVGECGTRAFQSIAHVQAKFDSDADGDEYTIDTEVEARARLIAAAPDLYAALQALIDYSRHLRGVPVWEQANAALSKASPNPNSNAKAEG